MTIASSLVRCVYPNCVLEEHETGDHRFGRPEKPWGTLRLIQEFHTINSGRCELCPQFRRGGLAGFPLHVAVAFYADMLGFGWALCAGCARTFSVICEPQISEPQEVAHGAKQESAAGGEVQPAASRRDQGAVLEGNAGRDREVQRNQVAGRPDVRDAGGVDQEQ